ncbi:MAG: sugar ABC transporter permease [Anaerolineae bacterium]|jgi:arabinogalactan oligomer/maltooligosaccharide transport system permease protein
MVGWSGRRKTLTILAFVLPTLLAIVVFSVYPFIYNGFISLTNRGRFHPNPDCSQTIWKIVEPMCWLGEPPQGLADPYSFNDPLLKNYGDLLGGLFTADSVLALGKVALAVVPLLVALFVNRRMGRRLTRPVPAWVVWLAGLAVAGLLFWLLNLPEALRTLSASGDFIMVNVRTILYVVICIPLFFVMGLTMALILNNDHLKGRTFFRVVLIVPWAASTVAIMMSLIWQFFFRQQGTINQLLALVNIEGPAYLNEDVWAFAIVVLVNLWYTYPFFMVVILGGLQSITPDLYEAADVDGASWWQQLMNITLPLLRPAILPAIVLSTLTTYKVDAVVWGLTKGGPVKGAGIPGATEFVMVHAYKQIFQTGAFGRMGAFAVILFVALFAATLYSLRMTQITRGAYE